MANILKDPQDEPIDAPYEAVAIEMNCSVNLLNQLNVLSDLKGKIPNVNSQSELKRNFGWHYCGRYYYRDSTHENESQEGKEPPLFWLGIFFERPKGYQLVIGFPEKTEQISDNSFNTFKALVKNHYNFYAEYTEILNGYWYYIYLDNLLLTQSITDMNSAQDEIVKIVNDII